MYNETHDQVIQLEGRCNFLSPVDSLRGKIYAEELLKEWEERVQGGQQWSGRSEMLSKLDEVDTRRQNSDG